MIINSSYQYNYNIRTEQKYPVLTWLLLLRNYTKRVRNDTNIGSRTVLTNGKSIIDMPSYLSESEIPGSINFEEFFENTDIESRGLVSTNINNHEGLFSSRNNSNSREYFRQVFLFDNKFVVLSFKINKYVQNLGYIMAPIPYGLVESFNCNYKILFEVSYYDNFNNDYFENKITVDEILYKCGEAVKCILPDQKFCFLVTNKSYKYISTSTERYIYGEVSENNEREAISALATAYKKIEELLGVSLQYGEKEKMIKKRLK